MKFLKFLRSKVALAGVVATCGVASALAEGTGTGVTSALVTDYITEGKTQIIAVLTAGAVIMGAFYVWGLIRRALNKSK